MVIEKAKIINNRVTGFIYGDERERFSDGTQIRTSEIESIRPDKYNPTTAVVATENTKYYYLPDYRKIYAVDFDGYLCNSVFPDIGEPNLDIIEHFKQLKLDGHYVILWTCRGGKLLEDAVQWCKAYGLEFDAVNENLQFMNELYKNDSRKIGADFYCDDKSYYLMPKGNA